VNVVTSLRDLDAERPAVLSIGNFDGLHLGHRAILDAVVRRAREIGARAAAMTFDPHPVRFFAPERAPKLIVPMERKIALIRGTGIDLLFVARFDAEFSSLDPDAFIRRYLVEGFRARAVCVGGNFSFGSRQSGTVETLKRWKEHFDTVEVAPVTVRGMLVSSTAVRKCIGEGAMGWARRLLGRWVEIEGRIVAGAGRGRRVTVPTYNLEPANELLPRAGVYASRISLDGSPYLDGVTNVGINPTFGGGELSIETHALSALAPAVASRARLQFLLRLRGERRFDSAEALRAQIDADIRRANRFFHRMRTWGHALAHTR
jgi:riboflavin kinase/FMN adenylyltransferase